MDLPVAKAQPQPRPDNRLSSVNPTLTLTLGNDPVPEAAIGQALASATNSDREQRIFCGQTKPCPTEN